MNLEEQRPVPGEVREAATLLRWYWLRSELVEIARGLGVVTSGGKLELTERICAYFEHRPPATVIRRASHRDTLPTELTPDVVLQEGQRCTQRLRMWMHEQVGPLFTFDAPMREAVGSGHITLRDLVARWYATRDRAPGEIAPQFELNRFSREWHAANPQGTHAQMLAAWARHRSLPR